MQGRVRGAFREVCASVLRMQNAFLVRSGRSLDFASAQGNLGTNAPMLHALRKVDAPMRRLFGPRGGAVRQDVLAATGVGGNSDAEDDFAALLAHRGAKQKRGRAKMKDHEGNK